MPENSTVESAQPDDAPTAPKRHGFKRWVFLGLAIFGGFAISYIWYSGSHIDDHNFTISELESGPVTQIIEWNGDRTAIQISKYSELPSDDLWRVVSDQARFDEFMPYVKSTKVREGPDGTLIATQVLVLPHASYDQELGIRFSEEDNVRKVRWEQLQGALRFNQGAWVVESIGDRSVLRYQVAARMSGVPQWFSNYAMRSRLSGVLAAIEERVRDLQERDPDYFK